MKSKKKLNIFTAIMPIIAVIALGLTSVLKWKAGMFIPLLGSILVTAIVGMISGYQWKEVQQGLVDGVSRALPALFILVIVGTIVGTWIQGGVIPTMIYYSLKIISPKIFIPASFLVTAIIATATGTSFTSIATIGLALMATGLGLGFKGPLLAGAIISGAFFGDSISPLSDSTNLSSAMTQTNLFEVIGHMLYTSVPALIISAIIYYFMGAPEAKDIASNSDSINQLLEGINASFKINPLLLLVPVVTVVLSMKKFPTLPTLVTIAIIGGLCSIFVQGATVSEVVRAMTNGNVSETGVDMVDKLLSSGGITSMSNTVMLMTLATALGGVLETIGSLETISEFVMKPVKTTGGLVLVTVLSGFVVAFATGAQLLAIVLPARMYPEEFKKRNLHPKNLARIATSIGSVCITLVPWSVPAVYASNILSVQPGEFIKYLYFPMVLATLIILCGYSGITMSKLNKDQEMKVLIKQDVTEA